MTAKICILTSVHPPFDGRVFHKEVKTLVKAGYDVVLIAQHNKEEVVDGIKIIPLPKPRNRFERMTRVVWKLFKLALKEKADIYHFHDPELMLVGWLLKLMTNAKVIYDVHEDYPQHMLSKEWLPKPLRKLASWLIWEMEKLCGRYFDAVVTPTDSITERFQRLKARRTLTLYNFPSISSITDDFAPYHKVYDLIHVGTLSTPRLSVLFSVALELRKMNCEAKWCILGVSQQLAKWAKERLVALQLVDNFSLIGWVPYDEVRKFLSQSRIGINYHPAESRFLVAIPVKVFEYMACGLPVISSELPLLRKLIGDEDCALLVKPGSVQEFAKAIKYLLNNSDIAEKMGSIGKMLIREKYNWEKEKQKLLQLYNELLEAK